MFVYLVNLIGTYMKLKNILSIVKKGAGVVSGASFAGAAGIYAFDEILAIISALTGLISAMTAGIAYTFEVWAKATGRIPLDADIDGK
jgi:hypothetical protein